MIRRVGLGARASPGEQPSRRPPFLFDRSARLHGMRQARSVLRCQGNQSLS